MNDIPKPVEKSATMLCGIPFSRRMEQTLLRPATRVNGRALGKTQWVGVYYLFYQIFLNSSIVMEKYANNYNFFMKNSCFFA